MMPATSMRVVDGAMAIRDGKERWSACPKSSTGPTISGNPTYVRSVK
jgi:hypothetical protein